MGSGNFTPFTLPGGIYSDPLFVGLTPSAFTLYVHTYSYAVDYETGGLVPAIIARHCSPGRRSTRPTAELLDRTLWLTEDEFYFRIVDWAATKRRRGLIPDDIRQGVYERDHWRCVTCGSPENLSLDHIYPWSLGGSDNAENLQTLCRPCNSRKGAKV